MVSSFFIFYNNDINKPWLRDYSVQVCSAYNISQCLWNFSVINPVAMSFHYCLEHSESCFNTKTTILWSFFSLFLSIFFSLRIFYSLLLVLSITVSSLENWSFISYLLFHTFFSFQNFYCFFHFTIMFLIFNIFLVSEWSFSLSYVLVLWM